MQGGKRNEKWGVSERLISERDAYLYRQLDPDGIEVSGGEGQKIAIARAFYKDTDIIIMDEPTSSLIPYPKRRFMREYTQNIRIKR